MTDFRESLKSTLYQGFTVTLKISSESKEND